MTKEREPQYRKGDILAHKNHSDIYGPVTSVSHDEHGPVYRIHWIARHLWCAFRETELRPFEGSLAEWLAKAPAAYHEAQKERQP